MKIEEKINLIVEVSKEDWMNKAVFKEIPTMMKDIKKMVSKNEYKYAVMKIDSILAKMKTLRDLYEIEDEGWEFNPSGKPAKIKVKWKK